MKQQIAQHNTEVQSLPKQTKEFKILTGILNQLAGKLLKVVSQKTFESVWEYTVC